MPFFADTTYRAAARKPRTHLTYTIAEETYAVEIDMVSEILPFTGLSPLCEDDEAVAGQIELRGSAIIVVDMGIRLQGKPVSRDGKCCILIVKRENNRNGCLMEAPGVIIGITPEETTCATLSGCLVQASNGTESLPENDCARPENTSVCGKSYGFKMCKTKGDTILIPDRELYYPR